MLVTREAAKRLQYLAKTFRAVAVIGPRQSGKTTLCKMVFPKKPYVSLETPTVLQFAQTDPEFPKGFIMHLKLHNGMVTNFTSSPDLYVGGVQLVNGSD